MRRRRQVRPLCVWFAALRSAQVAALASLATLPVLVAHGMSTSLVGIVCNIAGHVDAAAALQMGILLLIFQCCAVFTAACQPTGLALSLWLKGNARNR